MLRTQLEAPGIFRIDVDYDGQESFAAAYLVVSDDRRGAFIDMGTEACVPGLLEVARSLAGLGPEHIDLLIPTHIHLDHAAGCGELARRCAGARVLCHPRAARHLADPAKLEAGVIAVYGEAFYRRLYGALKPIAAERIFSPADAEWVSLGRGSTDSLRRRLQILHTPGHAKHHICIWDPETRSVFTGDSFGLAYPALAGTQAWIFPSTSPSDFNPEDQLATLARIEALQPARVLPTHFGAVERVGEAAQALRKWIAIHASALEEARIIAGSAVASGRATDRDALQRELTDLALSKLKPEFACAVGNRAEHLELLDLDIRLNAQGIAVAAISACRA